MKSPKYSSFGFKIPPSKLEICPGTAQLVLNDTQLLIDSPQKSLGLAGIRLYSAIASLDSSPSTEKTSEMLFSLASKWLN